MFIKEIATIGHALDVLELFSSGSHELGVTEIAARLSLSKNNVFRLLATLQSKGFVEQNQHSDEYRLGPKILEVGQAYLSRQDIIKVAHPILEEMVRTCGESAYLARLHGSDVVYLDLVQTAHPLRLRSRLGWRLPAHCTAAGKVLLAFEPKDRLEQVLTFRKLARFTPHTIVSKVEILRHLRQVAESGIALDMEEWEPDVRCVAAPIRDHEGVVSAAVVISAPLIRMPAERIREEIIPLVRQSAEEISRRLGHLS